MLFQKLINIHCEALLFQKIGCFLQQRLTFELKNYYTVKNNLSEIDSKSAMITSMMLGGIRIPRVPEAAMVPVASGML